MKLSLNDGDATRTVFLVKRKKIEYCVLLHCEQIIREKSFVINSPGNRLATANPLAALRWHWRLPPFGLRLEDEAPI
jgi:hypothetical protein